MKLFSAFSALTLCLGARADLKYRVVPEPASRSILVSLTIDSDRDSETVRIPAWSPGYYLILNYQDGLTMLGSSDPAGHDLAVSRLDLRGWKIANPSHTPITVRYRVAGDDPGLGFFGVHVEKDNAYWNGAGAFLYPEGRLKERDELAIDLPEGWNVATSMDRQPDGAFYAQTGYDELIDHPVQLGHFVVRSFLCRGIPFSVVFVAPEGQIECDVDAETRRLAAMSAPAIDLFHGAGFKRYLYLLHLKVGNFSGGLEHRGSNVQAIQNTKHLNLDELATHEYFHAWNVKQIRPYVLGPFDYSREQKTGALWFAEGVTDYYAYITAYRSGLFSREWLLEELGGQIQTLQQSSKRLSVTLEECSRRAWENGGIGVGDLSYYNKGLVAGLLFDAAIRARTGGKRSLDDVMRLMFDRYRLPQPGYSEDGILEAMNEVAGSDLGPMYHRICQTTAEMPYEALAGIGLAYNGALVKDPDASAPAQARLAEWFSISPRS